MQTNKTCTATFTVTAPACRLTLFAHPLQQWRPAGTSAVDTLFTNWKNNVSFSGGCSLHSWHHLAAPPKCGGSTTVAYARSPVPVALRLPVSEHLL
ncbi:MAG: hypothetical protein U0T81_04185 [Saprospiraceae bacterium]